LNSRDFNEEGIELYAENIYQDFCEHDGTLNIPLQQVWDELTILYGEIEIGSPIERLFYETVKYTLKALNEYL
jgi:hypothetical protein